MLQTRVEQNFLCVYIPNKNNCIKIAYIYSLFSLFVLCRITCILQRKQKFYLRLSRLFFHVVLANSVTYVCTGALVLPLYSTIAVDSVLFLKSSSNFWTHALKHL